MQATVDERVSILVVDDHPENVAALQGVLARPDYEVVSACSGSEALKRILKHDFAVILLDVLMPGMDGFQTARLIRERERSRGIPILFLTATGSDLGMIDRAYSVGAVDYLVKPLDADVVRAKVAVFVDLHRKTRRLQRLREAEQRKSEIELRARDTDRLRAEDGQRLLARAGEVLLSSLEVKSALDTVARLSVPALADGCAIYLTAENDAASAELIALAGDGAEARREELQQACDGGLPIELENAEALPLMARGRALGSLVLIFSPRRRPDSRDRSVAQDLCQRVAFAVDNARLYRSSQEAIRLRDEFLSIASHELRTPLTPLQLNLQRLCAERGDARQKLALPPEKVRSALIAADRQVRRLSALVDNLLDVSRITMGRLELHREEMDLAEVAAEVIARFDELGGGGALVKLEQTGPVRGSWDRLRIEQVLTNLLSNALKYGESRPVEVRVGERDGAARLEVQDHGIGIAPEELGRIFGRFERAVSSRNYGGLGLGLYITRQIVEAHCGEVTVQSAPGDGSVFSVELPVALEESRPQEPAATQH